MFGNDSAENQICIRIVYQAVSSTFRAVQAVTGLYCFLYSFLNKASASFQNENHLAAVVVGMQADGCSGNKSCSGKNTVCPIKIHSCIKVLFASLEILQMRDLYFAFSDNHIIPFIKQI